jgi:hypothetical protein
MGVENHLNMSVAFYFRVTAWTRVDSFLATNFTEMLASLRLALGIWRDLVSVRAHLHHIEPILAVAHVLSSFDEPMLRRALKSCS